MILPRSRSPLAKVLNLNLSENGALRCAVTHPTGVARLKSALIKLLWDGRLARPGRTRCPTHKKIILQHLKLDTPLRFMQKSNSNYTIYNLALH